MKWISVKDKLPPFGDTKDYFVCVRGRAHVCYPSFWGDADGEYGINGWYKSDGCDCSRSMQQVDRDYVTHWAKIEAPSP